MSLKFFACHSIKNLSSKLQVVDTVSVQSIFRNESIRALTVSINEQSPLGRIWRCLASVQDFPELWEYAVLFLFILSVSVSINLFISSFDHYE